MSLSVYANVLWCHIPFSSFTITSMLLSCICFFVCASSMPLLIVHCAPWCLYNMCGLHALLAMDTQLAYKFPLLEIILNWTSAHLAPHGCEFSEINTQEQTWQVLVTYPGLSAAGEVCHPGRWHPETHENSERGCLHISVLRKYLHRTAFWVGLSDRSKVITDDVPFLFYFSVTNEIDDHFLAC